MEIIVNELFVDHYLKCPVLFQQEFRHIYEQLENADSPFGIEGVERIGKSNTDLKIIIGKSKIGLRYDGKVLKVTCFIFNQFYKTN